MYDQPLILKIQTFWINKYYFPSVTILLATNSEKIYHKLIISTHCQELKRSTLETWFLMVKAERNIKKKQKIIIAQIREICRFKCEVIVCLANLICHPVLLARALADTYIQKHAVRKSDMALAIAATSNVKAMKVKGKGRYKTWNPAMMLKSTWLVSTYLIRVWNTVVLLFTRSIYLSTFHFWIYHESLLIGMWGNLGNIFFVWSSYNCR